MVSAQTGQAYFLPALPFPTVGPQAGTEIDTEVEMLNPNSAWLKTLRIAAGMILVAAMLWVFIVCAFVYP